MPRRLKASASRQQPPYGDAHGDDCESEGGPAEGGATFAAPAEQEQQGRQDREDGRDEDRPDGRGDSRGPRSGGAVRRTENGTVYRVAVGHRDGAQPGAIVGALTNEGGLTGQDLGKIDIFPSFSLVEIATELTPDALDRISRARVAGRPLRIRVDEGPGPRSAHDRAGRGR